MSNVTKMNTVTLTMPVQIDGQPVHKITLRKPMGGELRGLSLVDILRMEMSAMLKLLPRITQPPLSAQQLQTEVEPQDLTDLASKTTLFFVRKEQMEGEFLELEADPSP